MRVKISVTKKDYRGANYFNPTDCPNARAIKRVVNPEVNVRLGGREFWLNGEKLPLPSIAIYINDQPRMGVYFTEDAKPFSYILEIPAKYLKWRKKCS